MQQLEPSPAYLKLNVWTATLTSAIAGVIIAVLLLPFHLMMHGRAMRPDMGPAGGPPMQGSQFMHPPMSGAGVAGWILIGLIVVIVYSGVAGAIFAAIYNALLPKR